MTSVLLPVRSIVVGGWYGPNGYTNPSDIFSDGWWGLQDCYVNVFSSSVPVALDSFVSSIVAGSASFVSSKPDATDSFVTSAPGCNPWIKKD